MQNGNGYPPMRSRANQPYGFARYRVKSEPYEKWIEQGLTLAGSLLMPTGMLAIVLGWWGAANTGYVFEQLAYLISGGLFGLGMAGVGGFLFFGSWLARITHQQRRETELLAVSLNQVTSAIAAREGVPDAAPAQGDDTMVVGGVHQRRRPPAGGSEN